MLILHPNGTLEQVADLPSDYASPEWKAYDQALERVIEQGEQWSDECDKTYNTYHGAMQRKAERGE